MYDGTVIFNDFTLEQPFHHELTYLTLTADDINSGAEELVLRTHAVLNKDRTLEAELGLDPIRSGTCAWPTPWSRWACRTSGPTPCTTWRTPS